MGASRVRKATGAGQDCILSQSNMNGALYSWFPKKEKTHCCKLVSTPSMQGQRGRGRRKAKSTNWDLKGAKAIFLLFTK